MIDDSLEYQEQRAYQERQAAHTCSNGMMASMHRLLAIQYEAEAGELRASRVQRTSLNPVSNSQ
jgi:hypothetical protein